MRIGVIVLSGGSEWYRDYKTRDVRKFSHETILNPLVP